MLSYCRWACCDREEEDGDTEPVVVGWRAAPPPNDPEERARFLAKMGAKNGVRKTLMVAPESGRAPDPEKKGKRIQTWMAEFSHPNHGPRHPLIRMNWPRDTNVANTSRCARSWQPRARGRR